MRAPLWAAFTDLLAAARFDHPPGPPLAARPNSSIPSRIGLWGLQRRFEPWQTTGAGEQQQSSAQSPEARERTLDVRSNPGRLLERVSSDGAQPRV